MTTVKAFTFNPFQENTYIISDQSRECVIIDPGCSNNIENSQVLSYIDDNNLNVKAILNTHCHIDHVLGNYFLQQHFKVPVFIHPKDEQTLKSVAAYAPVYGVADYQESDYEFYDGDNFRFGSTELEILFVPGHAPGHIALYNRKEGYCIGGDVLFNGSIGRTDLPGGDFDTLIESIDRELFSLPDETLVYCGHGPETTIAKEKSSNPFCGLNIPRPR